jgi:hypothetical protein
MKATKQIYQLAQELDAEIQIWADSENSYTIEATAPDNMLWTESGGVSLVARWWTYDKTGKAEAMLDIYTRMQIGLESEFI